MVRSLYSGVSGLTTHQTRMDVIGNNIANVNTYGFKASRVTFRDIYYQTSVSASAGTAAFAGNNPSTVGYGVQLGSIDKDMSQSSSQNTNRVLDIAINGDGFFITATFDGSKVDENGEIPKDLSPKAINYTRMGNFGVDSNGNLVAGGNLFVLGTCNTDDGLAAVGDESAAALEKCNILDSGAEESPETPSSDDVQSSDLAGRNIININELINKAWPQTEDGGDDEEAQLLTFSDLSSFDIGKNGVITATYNSQMKALARIEVAVFDNQDGLIEDGNTSFVETAASGIGKIKRPGYDQGAPNSVQSNKLEMSNVNLAQEFSDMIVTQRGYQANARIITTSDSMLEELVNLKR